MLYFLVLFIIYLKQNGRNTKLNGQHNRSKVPEHTGNTILNFFNIQGAA